MRLRLWCSVAVIWMGLAALPSVVAQEAAGQLTVKRIYSQPNLSGQISGGVQWTPDGKRVSFFETKGLGKDAKRELWVMDATSGQKQILVDAQKMESIQPPEKGRASQATGSGRRAAPQYWWTPDGKAILFIAPKILTRFDVGTQQAKVLVSGDATIADVKLSPDGRYASFVRRHNLFVAPLAGGAERAVTTGGTEEVRKGELDWVYPEELDARTAYWWSPDSKRIAFLEMDERRVTKYPLLDFASYDGDMEEERYPVAGGKNPILHVYCVELAGGKAKLMDSGTETDQYIPLVSWLQDSKRLAIQRLNRPQTQLDLLMV